MILTGLEIKKSVESGKIQIDDFSPERVNPNSYNYQLGSVLKVFNTETNRFEHSTVSENGFVLEPRMTYLGHTKERIGSEAYAMRLIGRSSLGRLGLFLQVSADLGHTRSFHKWTLELVALRPIRLYPDMTIGQVSFWTNLGDVPEMPTTYSNFNEPMECVS